MDRPGNNVKIFVRIRSSDKRTFKSVDVVNDKKVAIKERPSDRSVKQFVFDKVFDSDVTQDAVFDLAVGPLIEDMLKGYNCTVFAFGQSGSSKTLSSHVENSSSVALVDQDSKTGLMARSLGRIFDKLNSLGFEYAVRVSFLGICNEELIDLLSSKEDALKLKLMDDNFNKGGIIVHGLEEVIVCDKKSAFEILNKGCMKRNGVANLPNSNTSRSHAVFTITVHFKKSDCLGEVFFHVGKLNLVDLANTENFVGSLDSLRDIGRSNQSLLTFGRVIMSLNDNLSHVPYRESKLTRLLQDSLGGSTKTSMIATVSPDVLDVDETLSTLNLMSKAKNIINKPHPNKCLSPVDLKQMYSEEMSKLQRELDACRGNEGFYISAIGYSELLDEITNLRQEKQNLIKELHDLKIEYNKKQALLDEDDRQTQQQLADQLNVTQKCISDHLKAMGKILKADAVAVTEKLHLRNESLKKVVESNNIAISSFQQKHSDNMSKVAAFVEEIGNNSGILSLVKSHFQNRHKNEKNDRKELELRILEQHKKMIDAFNNEKELIVKKYENKIQVMENVFSEFVAATEHKFSEASKMFNLKMRLASESYEILLKSNEELERKYLDEISLIQKKFELSKTKIEDLESEKEQFFKNLSGQISELQENNYKIGIFMEKDSLQKQIIKNHATTNNLKQINFNDFNSSKEVNKFMQNQQSFASKFQEMKNLLCIDTENCLRDLKNTDENCEDLIKDVQLFKRKFDSNCISHLEEMVEDSKSKVINTVAELNEYGVIFANKLALINHKCVELVDSIKQYGNQNKDTAIEYCFEVDESIKKISMEKTNVMSLIGTVKESVNNFCNDKLEDYTPTGETPKRQDYNFQRQFKGTSPQEQLRERFKRQNILREEEEQ